MQLDYWSIAGTWREPHSHALPGYDLILANTVSLRGKCLLMEVPYLSRIDFRPYCWDLFFFVSLPGDRDNANVRNTVVRNFSP
jgi:hypothetical protein